MKDRKVTIRINLDRLPFRVLILALLLAALLGLVGSVAWAGARPTPVESRTYAPLLQGGSGRQYYLTDDTVTGGAAPGACAGGYHMASVWEILDVSNLTYNTSLGYQHTTGDEGEGPPTNVEGWVRTGDQTRIGPVAPGQDNCAVYSSSSGGYSGTIVSLPNNWTIAGSIIGPWVGDTAACDSTEHVWCVED